MGQGDGGGSSDRWLRRQAIQLAGQLPEDTKDARLVIEYMKQLVDSFIDEQRTASEKSGTVTPLKPRNQSG